MTDHELQRLLEDVRTGAVDPAAASVRVLHALRAAPFEDLGFARVDTHRAIRQGFPEVILGIGKTPAQIAAIAERIVQRGQTLLVTRATGDAYAVRDLVGAAGRGRGARGRRALSHLPAYVVRRSGQAGEANAPLARHICHASGVPAPPAWQTQAIHSVYSPRP